VCLGRRRADNAGLIGPQNSGGITRIILTAEGQITVPHIGATLKAWGSTIPRVRRLDGNLVIQAVMHDRDLLGAHHPVDVEASSMGDRSDQPSLRGNIVPATVGRSDLGADSSGAATDEIVRCSSPNDAQFCRSGSP
jgi:hypothetical protein